MTAHVEVMGLREIAEAFGVSQRTASRWARLEGFPRPLPGTVSGWQAWNRAEVMAWTPPPRGRPRKDRGMPAASDTERAIIALGYHPNQVRDALRATANAMGAPLPDDVDPLELIGLPVTEASLRDML